MVKTFDVKVTWPVSKTYEVDAEDEEAARRQVEDMLDRGNICVWTDGFEAEEEGVRIGVCEQEAVYGDGH